MPRSRSSTALASPIPRAVVRPVWQTSVDLRDRGSQDPGLRLLSWSELRKGDYVFVDRELMRVRELPKGPDEDVRLTQLPRTGASATRAPRARATR